MARLFYHKPKFAILDECTSAVTTDMEERFCSKVRAMGTSCITISHRPALVAFHDVVLSLDGEGGWRVHYKRYEAEVINLLTHVLSESRYLLLVCSTKSPGQMLLVSLTLSSIKTRILKQIAKVMQWLYNVHLQMQKRFGILICCSSLFPETISTSTNSSIWHHLQGTEFSKSEAELYFSELISASPSEADVSPLPVFPQLKSVPRILPLRIAAMSKILVSVVLLWQLAWSFLVGQFPICSHDTLLFICCQIKTK